MDLLAGLTGLDAPSSMPDRPVTDGADAGAGAGMSALGLPSDPVAEGREDAQHLQRYLPAMIRAAQSDNATPSFKRYVRRIIANL